MNIIVIQTGLRILIVMGVFCHLELRSQFVLNGTAVELEDNCYRFTDSVNGSTGTMWHNEKIDLRV